MVNPRKDPEINSAYWEASNNPEFCEILVAWAKEMAARGVPISWAPTMAKDTMARALKLAGLKGDSNAAD